MIVCDEVEPLLPHLHPGDAFSRQVRVDGGELATDGEVVDDLLDGRSQLVHVFNILVHENLLHCKLDLVARGGATSAIFENFQEDVNLQLAPTQHLVIHEKKSLGNRKVVLGWSPDWAAPFPC